MGGSDTTQTTQSQSVQQLPPWINQAAQQNYGFAQNVAEQPLQQYQGQMVADVGPQMQQSWNTAASGANAGQDQYNAAQAGLLGVMGQAPQQVTAGQLSNTNLQPYMNPYTQSVINTTLPLMQQQNALSQNQAANQANSANAFGGSRQGIQQGVAQAQGAQNIGQMAAQLNQANFGQAQAGAQFDITGRNQAALANQAAQQNQGNLNLQAASGMAGLGTQAQANAVKNFTMQQMAGTQQQAQAQNQINSQIQKFGNAANYPNQQLSILQSALGMTPYEQGQQSSSTQETQQSANPLAAVMSGAQTLGSLFSAPARRAAPWRAFGGLFSVLRPAAEDRHHPGRHAFLGHPHSRLSLQGRPEDLSQSGWPDGRGCGQDIRPRVGGEDPRLWRQDGGSPGDHGRAGRALHGPAGSLHGGWAGRVPIWRLLQAQGRRWARWPRLWPQGAAWVRTWGRLQQGGRVRSQRRR